MMQNIGLDKFNSLFSLITYFKDEDTCGKATAV